MKRIDAREFLRIKVRGLVARLSRLARIDNAYVGLRPQDMPFAPSRAHFRAANARLSAIETAVRRRFDRVRATLEREPLERVLIDIALVERELDRARRLFGMFFEVFAQRGTSFGPALAAHDAIAEDCYQAIRAAAPQVFRGPLLKPVCYMEHGFSPATMRRGVSMSRLLGEANPFPLIRIPWDRDQPWQAVFMHEVAHNLQADLGIWQENRQALVKRMIGRVGHPLLASIYGRWHKEIWADLAAILLGGPAAAWGMAEFLAHPSPRTLTYRPGGAHPTAFLRVAILAEMLRRMGFVRDADSLNRVWRTLYRPERGHRMPGQLLSGVDRVVAEVVDETMFQTRRNLGQRAVADIIPFGPDDQAAILAGAGKLVSGAIEAVDLPPRHLVSAAAYAVASGLSDPRRLADQINARLAEQARGGRERTPLRTAAAPRSPQPLAA